MQVVTAVGESVHEMSRENSLAKTQFVEASRERRGRRP